MNVLDKIHIELYSNDRCDLSGIILDLKIKAGRKNPYYITTPKTDADGKTVLTKENLKGQFEDRWERHLMDYDGLLDDADQVIEVSLYDPT